MAFELKKIKYSSVNLLIKLIYIRRCTRIPINSSSETQSVYKPTQSGDFTTAYYYTYIYMFESAKTIISYHANYKKNLQDK